MTKLELLFIAFIMFFSTSCTNLKWQVNTIDKETVSNIDIENAKLSAIVFLAPGCPLSEASILELNKLHQKYGANNYQTYVCITGTLFSTEEIKAFVDTFGIQFKVLVDSNAFLMNELGATITPEYYLLDRDAQIVYRGAIDDRAFDNEYVRPSISINYADSAIAQYLYGKSIKISQTKPVGCYIEL